MKIWKKNFMFCTCRHENFKEEQWYVLFWTRCHPNLKEFNRYRSENLKDKFYVPFHARLHENSNRYFQKEKKKINSTISRI